MNTHEEALIRAFVLPEKSQRILTLLQTAKGREKFQRSLAHFHYLDPRFAHPIQSHDKSPEAIYALLRSKGAPEMCHVLGEPHLDGHDVRLDEALDTIFYSAYGNFVSCVPGMLGYFEGEDGIEHYLLERDASHLHP